MLRASRSSIPAATYVEATVPFLPFPLPPSSHSVITYCAVHSARNSFSASSFGAEIMAAGTLHLEGKRQYRRTVADNGAQWRWWYQTEDSLETVAKLETKARKKVDDFLSIAEDEQAKECVELFQAWKLRFGLRTNVDKARSDSLRRWQKT